MTENIEYLLSTGLKQGFAGGTVMNDVERGNFGLKSSHFENENGVYHDEWFADRAGGGQEIVKVGDSIYTRVYAGGTISPDAISKLGISDKDIMIFLRKQIIENGERIRLFTNFEPEAEGDWQYQYKVVDNEEEIPLTVGKEIIKYKDTLVFVHVFIISPVD